MFCSKCGKELDDDAQFCSGCGSKLNEPQSTSSTVMEEKEEQGNEVKIDIAAKTPAPSSGNDVTESVIKINERIFSLISVIFKYMVSIAKFILYAGLMLFGGFFGRYFFGLVDDSVFWSAILYGFFGLCLAYILDMLFLGQITTTIEIDENLKELNSHLKEYNKSADAEKPSKADNADDYSTFMWVCFWVILVGIAIGGAVLLESFFGFILGLIIAFIINIFVFGFIATTLNIDKKVKNLKNEIYTLTKKGENKDIPF